MSFGKTTLAGLALGIAGLTISAQALAGVVVSSSGPSADNYPVGTQIGDSQRITLQAGDALTVLDNGGTRVFRGEGTYMLSEQSRASRNRAFASLTRQRSATRARTGAVRDPLSSGPKTNPNLWYIDVDTAGTICLADAGNIRLWRASTAAESTYSLSGEGVETSVTFPAGEMLAAWDIYNPPEAGTAYAIGTGSSAVEVSFVFLEEVPRQPEDLAVTLIENGCTTQLNQMSTAMMGN